MHDQREYARDLDEEGSPRSSTLHRSEIRTLTRRLRAHGAMASPGLAMVSD
jgi:hypothetical protein